MHKQKPLYKNHYQWFEIAMHAQTFYALIGETENLSFFCCSGNQDHIEGYGALLEHLYQAKQNAFDDKRCFAIASGNPEVIVDFFTKCYVITNYTLARTAIVRQQMEEIFKGKTQAPLIYIDGLPEDIEQHFALLKQIAPNYVSQGTFTEV